jgi:hypothetical protein
MENKLTRWLKFIELIDGLDEKKYLDRMCAQFNAYLKKHGHYKPDNNGVTPNPWRRNMDYADWENSPYFGSVSEFLKKFPGGIKDWIKWRRENQKKRNLKWSSSLPRGKRSRTHNAYFIDTKKDKTEDFPKEPHLWSGDMGKFKSITEFLKKYRNQDASDINLEEASQKAIEDFVNYWKLLKKINKRRKKQ